MPQGRRLAPLWLVWLCLSSAGVCPSATDIQLSPDGAGQLTSGVD